MRHLMWTPLPPERSGISDYSHELMEAMSGITDVTAVGRDAATAQVPAGVPVIGPEAANESDGLHIYQMGNNTQFHKWIYQQALAVPGLVVLHDPSLLDFNLSYFGGIDAPEFKKEVDYAHGPIWGDPADPALIRGWPSIEVDGVKHVDRLTMTLERRIVSASLGVLVHDPYRAGYLRARYPEKPVFTVASGAPTLEEDDMKRTATRAKLGWGDDSVVFGVFGGFTAIKRMRVAVLAFAHVRKRWPQARLLIVGHSREKDIEADVHRAIADLGLADSVRIIPSPDKDEFQDLIISTDAMIGLRWPTAGETSAVMMRTFGAGRIFITSDLTQHRHLDPSFCWLVSTDPAKEAEELIGFLERIVCWPEEAREAGKKARQYVRDHASWPVIAATYCDAAEALRPGRPRPARPPARPGVNVFADVRADNRQARSARRHASALSAAEVDMTFTEFNTRVPNRSLAVPRELDNLRRGKDYPADLWLVDLTEFHLIPEHSLDRHTVAMWTGEIPEIPARGLAQLARLDELWVPSSLAADVFRTVTDIPITVIPAVVPPASPPTGDRAGFTPPEDGLVVLATLDALSDHVRENPWAVIEAFGRAFPPADRGRAVHLVIGVAGLDGTSEVAAELARAIDSVGGTLIGGHLTEQDIDGLLASCDIYLSLHRFATFGLDMAKAMSRRKPVIATGHGGNLDFMPPGSAAVIGYDLYERADAEYGFTDGFSPTYPLGHTWAEPDIEQAARWLRKLAGSQELRRVMGDRAAEAVGSVCGPEIVDSAMVRRLAEITLEVTGR